MSFQPRILFTLGVMVVAAYAVYASRDWSLGTGLFPWFVGIPVLVLAVIQMILDTYQSFRPANAAHTDTGDLQVDMSMGMGVVLYLKYQAKEGWASPRASRWGLSCFSSAFFTKSLMSTGRNHSCLCLKHS